MSIRKREERVLKLSINKSIASGVIVAGLMVLSAFSASAATVKSITLSPQAVSLSNPTSSSGTGTAKRIGVSLAAFDPGGKRIRGGTFKEPITLKIYGPQSSVLTAETTTISSPQSTVYFKYNGGYVANSIIATAVSGNAFDLMTFQPQNRNFAGTTSTVFSMPATNNAESGWHFRLSVGGGKARGALMDTGSRGVVVPESALGSGAVGPGAPGKMEYSSDGKVFKGHYYLAPVTLKVGGVETTTVPMQVLAIDSASCDPKYPKCVPGNANTVSMMGVGFDRGGIASSTPPEFTNPFLALTSIIQGSMHPGYIVEASGVTLGITTANKAGYGLEPLTAGGSGPGDWNTESGCFSFPGISGYAAQCGTVLVDTGIKTAIVGLPKAQRPPSIKSSIPNGVQMQIALPSVTSPVLSYGFTTGDGGPSTPTNIRWAGGSAPFMNTGRRPIAQNNYLFDAGAGQVGFKAAGP